VQSPCYHFDEERLKLRAQRHGRSLQGEFKGILEASAILSMSEAGGALSDNTRRSCEDRER
jgi:plasmid stability protein